MPAKLKESDYVRYVKSFDIFCALETFTRENFDFSIHFNDFDIFQSPAIKLSKFGRVSGGIVVFLKKWLRDYITRVDCTYDHMVSVIISNKLFNHKEDILCSFIYVPPYLSPYYKNKDWTCHIEKLEDFLIETFENHGNLLHMVLGDFNSRVGEWTLEEDGDSDFISNDSFTFGDRHSKDKCTNQFSKPFIDLCRTFQLVPLNGNCNGDQKGSFTFIADQGNSVVDYALLSTELFMSNNYNFEVDQNRVESSHSPINLSLTVFNCSDLTKNANTRECSTFEKQQWDDDNANDFIDNISNNESQCAFRRALLTIDTCIDSAVNIFNSTILKAAECMKRTIRLTSGQHAKNRWYDAECRDKKRSARRARRKYDRTDDGKDKIDYIQKRNLYKDMLKEKDKAYKRDIKDTLIEERKNSFKFWNTSKNIRHKLHSQPDIELDKWKSHFVSVFNNHNQSEHSEPKEHLSHKYPEDVYIPELDDSISESEIKEAIHNLKPGKAPGLDGICGEYLKYSEHMIIPFLHKLFNKLYDLCHFPFDWSKAIIVPLLKKGDETNLDNYRGISLLSLVSKVFTFILNKRLYSWAETQNKISPEQAGFRKSYSTIDHIFTLYAIVQDCFNNKKGGKVYVCFVDYRKAFDSVDRDKVWTKFQKLNLSSKFISMLQAIYYNVQACVRWKGNMTELFMCPFGVKQGCLMSPLIFSLLIGDVADYVRQNGLNGFKLFQRGQEIYSLLFADDIVLLSSTPHGLQRQINNLAKSSKNLGLNVNLDKTKKMVFRKGGFLGRRERWFLNGQHIDVVNSYKYLGYLFTTQLSEISACEEFESKAKGKVIDIIKTMWCIGVYIPSVFFQFFDCQVKPMLLYASEIWGLSKVENIEKAHLFAIKRLLSVSNKTPNTLVYGESGRYHLYIDSSLSAIRYWLKVLKMPETRYPKQCLIHMTSMLEKGERQRHFTVPWIKKIKDCLVKFGFTEVWINQGTCNERTFLKQLKDKMIEDFKIDWYQKLENSERFSVYRTFKFVFGTETYLANITLKRFRDALIRFRLGLNDMGINQRFVSNISKNCPFCPNTLEDEMHLLFTCKTYEDVRTKYLKEFMSTCNCTVKNVLMATDLNLVRKLGMYIYNCLKRRDEMICSAKV